MSNNKDIMPYNKKDQRHGYWIVYHNNDTLHYKGQFKNGYAIGLWEEYYLYGELFHKYYNNHHGNSKGIRIDGKK